MQRSYTIAELASAAGVHVETVRYYQRRLLLRAPARPPGSIRRYGDSDAEQLRFIKRAQTIGFTLSEIASLLKLRAHQSCSTARRLVRVKLEWVDTRMRELAALRSELAMLVSDCAANADDAHCPVFERLNS